MAKSKHKELVERIFEVMRESGLSADEQIRALAEARSQVGRAAAPKKPQKSYKPLTRPGGGIMGKQRRVAKQE